MSYCPPPWSTSPRHVPLERAGLRLTTPCHKYPAAQLRACSGSITDSSRAKQLSALSSTSAWAPMLESLENHRFHVTAPPAVRSVCGECRFDPWNVGHDQHRVEPHFLPRGAEDTTPRHDTRLPVQVASVLRWRFRPCSSVAKTPTHNHLLIAPRTHPAGAAGEQSTRVKTRLSFRTPTHTFHVKPASSWPDHRVFPLLLQHQIGSSP